MSLLPPAGARESLIAGTRVELRGLQLPHRPLAAAQDEPVVVYRWRVPAEHAAGRHGHGVVAAGGELQLARALERHRGPLRIGIVPGEQDPELVTRPSGPFL